MDLWSCLVGWGSTGLGKGLIMDFTKGSFFQDSLHTVDFRGSKGTLKVLLRRRSKFRWNAGLYFRVMVRFYAELNTIQRVH